MKPTIIFIILIALLSGCLETETISDRNYQFQSDPTKVPVHNDTLTLRTDGTFLLHTSELRYFGYQTNSSESGTYQETSKSIILSGIKVLTKDGLNLTDEDGGVYVRSS